jgi:hypothetical protein
MGLSPHYSYQSHTAEGEHLGDIRINGKTMILCLIKKYGMRVWSEYNSVGTYSVAGFCKLGHKQ